MTYKQREALKRALREVLVEAGGELDALEAFRLMKIKLNDERAPLLMCLEAGYRADDVLRLERPDRVLMQPKGEAALLELIEINKTANLAVLGSGTGSEHIAAALLHDQSAREWDYLRRFEHVKRFAMGGNGSSGE